MVPLYIYISLLYIYILFFFLGGGGGGVLWPEVCVVQFDGPSTLKPHTLHFPKRTGNLV